MSREEIDIVIRNLAMSQGYYGRLLARDDYEEILSELEWLKPETRLDIILALEV